METQESIRIWADATFGTDGSNARVAARANEEMAELLRALTSDDNHPKAPEEAADVVIVMCRLADRLGVNIQMEIEKEHSSALTSKGKNAIAAARANRHMDDLIGYTTGADDAFGDKQAAETSLHVLIYILGFLCARMGTTLQAEIDKKMAINRKRRWILDNTGHGYHSGDDLHHEEPGGWQSGGALSRATRDHSVE